MEIIAIVLMFVGLVALAAALSCIPALLVWSSFNWLAPQFGVAFHLHFLQTWVALFLLGIVGRTVFGSRAAATKS